jgi:arylsulfatase A-like enzyme
MTAFDTDIKVPLVVVGPGVPAGRRVTAFTENVDFYPTFVELGGGKPAANIDGRSLTPFLAGRSPGAWRDGVLVEHWGKNDDPTDPDFAMPGSGNPPTYKALRTQDLLYVEYETGEREYYDLSRDPEETTNLAGSLDQAQQQRLHEQLAALTSCTGDGCRRASLALL